MGILVCNKSMELYLSRYGALYKLMSKKSFIIAIYNGYQLQSRPVKGYNCCSIIADHYSQQIIIL